MDRITPQQRSKTMAAIRSKDTSPEILVRRLVFSLGYRYRLHVGSLPGSPDIVLASSKKVILVHGCFWHRHNCTLGIKMPKSRLDYWQPKLAKNKSRDAKNRQRLRRLGWNILVIWECQTRDIKKLSTRLTKFLKSGTSSAQSSSHRNRGSPLTWHKSPRHRPG